jgi:competence protein ComEA
MPLLEWLTPAERRGASVLVVILLAGTLHDAWCVLTDRRPPRSPAAVADTVQVDKADTLPSASSGTTQHPNPRVDLNHAETSELESLPGIGPVLARRIVEQRRRVGSFRRVEELLAVRGVGPRLLARLAPRVTVTSTPILMHSAPSPVSSRADSASASRTFSR